MLRFPAAHFFVDGCHDVRMGVCRRIHTQRNLLRSYYEVLGVTKDCTTKEIKAAYIQLCKKLHPDRKLQTSEKQFIELNNAYTTLIKPSLRATYDSKLAADDHQYKYRTTTSGPTGYPGRHPFKTENYYQQQQAQDWYNETIFEKRKTKSHEAHHDFNHRPRRYPDYVVVLGCILLIVIGASTHYFSYRARVISYRRTQEKNREILASYLEMRKQAIENGEEKQMAILRDKLDAAMKKRQVPSVHS